MKRQPTECDIWNRLILKVINIQNILRTPKTKQQKTNDSI